MRISEADAPIFGLEGTTIENSHQIISVADSEASGIGGSFTTLPLVWGRCLDGA